MKSKCLFQRLSDGEGTATDEDRVVSGCQFAGTGNSLAHTAHHLALQTALRGLLRQLLGVECARDGSLREDVVSIARQQRQHSLQILLAHNSDDHI